LIQLETHLFSRFSFHFTILSLSSLVFCTPIGNFKIDPSTIQRFTQIHTHAFHSNKFNLSKITTLEWLRERGGDFGAKTRPRNQTPMHFAAARGQVQTLKWLCENTQALGTFKIQKLRFSNCVTIIVVIIVKVIILT
jgi:hypothetical protein